jgi:hypothetical protein
MPPRNASQHKSTCPAVCLAEQTLLECLNLSAAVGGQLAATHKPELHSFTWVTMPRARQRVVVCDCFDCREQPASSDVTQHLSAANEAVARQEPPPKCLLLVMDGFLLPDPQNGGDTTLDACALPHMDTCARDGQLTLLALRKAADNLSELQQLMGEAQVCAKWTSAG